ncbi:PilZ domain-containing protein [Pseudobacteriovorax antillogorgiicola]|uniref:PilZ domain-containing protein n=1 Tax=Pseudobacteriovorax antillogorgiicola TaxID=1513793 RepID=A0A1Y6BQH2_9BACT|nr:PilZ domain-containing protein [Pseudobacteriovorax antillogorgiicola]TCS55314.1 PilZ domain-containing protein [Pseudobacteriovorax antillogorgiicola]SMF14324.1 PilZ domain-containing protein [Pseudobacteriovorax antillogorgiicola]
MSKSTLKILSIDEKRITSDLDKAGYRKIGAQIIHVSSYAEAERILSEQEINILVINYDYKEVDSVATCEHIKRSRNIPVVFTSVQNVPKKILKKELGPDLFIEQPIPRQYFIEKLRNLLDEQIRDTDRVTHGGSVAFNFEGEDVNCPIQDISKSGILLSTEQNLPSGTVLDMSFSIPGYKKPIRVEGEVVRKIEADRKRERAAGLGVRFKGFKGDSQKRLEKYILKSQNDDPKLVYYL